MTLDEAIKHAEEVAKQNEEDAVIYLNCKNHKKNLYETKLVENAEKKCCKCAEEHRQLAAWLKELKKLREIQQQTIAQQPIIMQWAEEHPIITKGMKFREVFGEDMITMLTGEHAPLDDWLNAEYK